MQGWHTTFLGMRGLPRDISDFEMKAFFTFDGAERDAINARRGDSHKLGLALHIGFLRMSGRLLGAFRVIPVALWRHLGNELGIAAPEVASLRAMYERGRTLFDHQQVACTVLGFQWMSEHQRRSLVRELRDEVARCADRDQLLVRARQWLYKNKLVIVHERAIRTLIAAALAQLEVETGTAIAASVDPATLDRWRASVSELRPDGQTQQSWLWAAPAKHSTRQISEVLERIDLLYTLDVHKHLADIPDLILRRYARRLVSRPPSAGAKIKEPARTVEVACFLRYCLFTTTDQLILMVQRRILLPERARQRALCRTGLAQDCRCSPRCSRPPHQHESQPRWFLQPLQGSHRSPTGDRGRQEVDLPQQWTPRDPAWSPCSQQLLDQGIPARKPRLHS